MDLSERSKIRAVNAACLLGYYSEQITLADFDKILSQMLDYLSANREDLKEVGFPRIIPPFYNWAFNFFESLYPTRLPHKIQIINHTTGTILHQIWVDELGKNEVKNAALIPGISKEDEHEIEALRKIAIEFLIKWVSEVQKDFKGLVEGVQKYLNLVFDSFEFRQIENIQCLKQLYRRLGYSFRAQVLHSFILLALKDGRELDDILKELDSIPTAVEPQTKREQLTEVLIQAIKESLRSCYFRKIGQNWAIRFNNGKSFILKDSKGLEHICRLLKELGQEIDVSQLIDPTLTSPVPESSMNSLSQRELSDHNLYSSAEIEWSDNNVRSAENLRTAKEHRERLLGELEKAEREGDPLVIKELQAEIEQIDAYYSNSYRDKELSAAYEANDKNRKAVSNAINRAIDEIKRHDSKFADHLNKCIHRGFTFKYTPTEKIYWFF